MRPVRWNWQRLIRLAVGLAVGLGLVGWLAYGLLRTDADSDTVRRYLAGYNREGLGQDAYHFPEQAVGARRNRPPPPPLPRPTSATTRQPTPWRRRGPAPTRRYGVLKPINRPRPPGTTPGLISDRIKHGNGLFHPIEIVPSIGGAGANLSANDGRSGSLFDWAKLAFGNSGDVIRSVPLTPGVPLSAATVPPLSNGLIGHRPFIERHLFVDGVFLASGSRFRVPQLAYRNISLVSLPTDGRIRHRLEFVAPFGQLLQTVATTDSVVEQRIYAHALLPTVLVHEVDILRRLGQVDLSTGFTVTFEREWPMPDGVDVTQLTLHNESLRRRLGYNVRVLQIATPGFSSRLGARVFVVYDQLPRDLETPRGKHRLRATFLQSSAPSLGDALAGYLAARRLMKSPPVGGGSGVGFSDRLGEAHMSAWRAVWQDSALLAEDSPGAGGSQFGRRLLAAQQQLLASLPLYRRLMPLPILRSGRLPPYTGLAFNGLLDETARVTYDQDLWSSTYLALTAPDMSAELLASRAVQLPAALARANRTGWSGARFCPEPRLSTGATRCHAKPSHSDYLRDDHVTGDVAIGAAAYLLASGQRAGRLASLGRTIVLEAARYYASRTVGTNLLPADAVVKDRRRRFVGTAFLVGVAKRALALPDLIGAGDANVTAHLARLGRRLRLPEQRSSDDVDGGVFYPDLAPTPGGVRFGPAMLPHPVGLALTRDALQRNLLAYAGALLAGGGPDPPVPLLAASAIAWMRLGQPKRAWSALRAALPHCSGPAGCTQLATGGLSPAPHNAAPLLSAVLFGYAGVRVPAPGGLVLGPCSLPPGVERLRLLGLHFHGHRLAVELADGGLTVRLAGWSAGRTSELSAVTSADDSSTPTPLRKIGDSGKIACDSEMRIVATPASAGAAGASADDPDATAAAEGLAEVADVAFGDLFASDLLAGESEMP